MKLVLSILTLIIITILGTLAFAFYKSNLGSAPQAFLRRSGDISTSINNSELPLQIPNGYELSVFAEGFDKPRVLATDSQKNLFVSDMNAGTVLSLPDSITLVGDLNKPHGLLFTKDKVYIAETDKVLSFDYDAGTKTASNKKVLTSLPSGGNHSSRTLIINPEDNNELLISIGSTCNVCIEKNLQRAVVMSLNLKTGDLTQFATGLRNAVFLKTRPNTNEIWVTEMGRDLLGDNTPPDEINILEKDNFYGWPFCFGNKIQDKSFNNSDESESICRRSEGSVIDLQAHSAPLGLEFLDKGTLLVAYHGSWNRSEPTGYKIMMFTINKGREEITRKDFVTGWLKKNGDVLGRPVDILKVEDSLYITDDKAGVVYQLKSI